MDYANRISSRLAREQNAALITDFASNLVSMISRNKGGRYMSGTNKTAVANSNMAVARDLLMQQQRDYNGRKAAFVFGDMIGGKQKSGIAGKLPAAVGGSSFTSNTDSVKEVWHNGPKKAVRDFAKKHSGYIYNLPAKQAEWSKIVSKLNKK